MATAAWGDIYKEIGATPIINAIGSVVFTISMSLVILAQVLLLTRRSGERRIATGVK